jgi:hypothetical protein
MPNGAVFRIMLDENVPAALRHLISGREVRPAYQMGWSGLANGDLIAAVEAAGFDIPITADSNIRYQQNLENRRIALIVLSTNIWPTIKASAERVLNAVMVRSMAPTSQSNSTGRPFVEDA